MKTLGIIPARYGSTRFPGKPLANINGKPMIQWVYENASKCHVLDDLIVATDHEDIQRVVLNFGGQCEITSSSHQTGTERCAEVAQRNRDFDVIINIQGDEPLINPKQIESLIHLFKNKEVQIGTLIKKSSNQDIYNDPNKIKTTVNKDGKALYFSRSGIPYMKESFSFYKHLGMYGYRSTILLELSKLKPSSLELAESLEQLRWMENGYSIYAALTEIECHSVDVPADIDVILQALK